ncbi:porin [Paraburkholderia sp. IW21]|uniref:porin n=1 Tax=Paraburkholderia sp. IW21 TaxID=3242488 RepID=UPI0035200C9B
MTGARGLDRFILGSARKRFALSAPLIASVLNCVATEAAAKRGVTLYGSIDAGLSYVTKMATESAHAPSLRYADGVAQGNRWGLRGSENLGNGLDAIFVLESAFSTSGGMSLPQAALFARKAYVGLSKRAIGALTYGRQNALSAVYVGSHYAMGSQSAAGTYAYHINDLDQLAAGRLSHALTFSSAKFAGFEFGGMVAFSNWTDRSTGSPAGDDIRGVDPRVASNAYSVGFNYTGEPFGMGAAYTRIGFPMGATAPVSATVANVKVGVLRSLSSFAVGGRYTVDVVRVWGNVTRTTLTPTAGASSELDNFEAGVRYALTPIVGAALGYTRSTLTGGSSGRWDQINLALDYAVSKRTDVYVLAIRQMASGRNTVAGMEIPVQAEIGARARLIGNSGNGAGSQAVVRIGLRHRF